MKPIIVVSPKLTKLLSIFIDVYAITIFPFIFCFEPINDIVENHETIHYEQQKELLLVFFYLLYAFFFIKGYVQYGDYYKAYMSIPFEKEAYANQRNLEYLEQRHRFSWLNYLK